MKNVENFQYFQNLKTRCRIDLQQVSFSFLYKNKDSQISDLENFQHFSFCAGGSAYQAVGSRTFLVIKCSVFTFEKSICRPLKIFSVFFSMSPSISGGGERLIKIASFSLIFRVIPPIFAGLKFQATNLQILFFLVKINYNTLP